MWIVGFVWIYCVISVVLVIMVFCWVCCVVFGCFVLYFKYIDIVEFFFKSSGKYLCFVLLDENLFVERLLGE